MNRGASIASGTMIAFTGLAAQSLACRAARPPWPLATGYALPRSSFTAGATVLFRRRRTPVRLQLAMKTGPVPNSGAAVEEEVDPGAVVGTDLRVLRYPHPLLRAANEEVGDSVDDMEEVKRISKEMLLVMYAAKGVGLAAPQVGVNKRLMVFNPEGDAKAWVQEVVLVNPVIVGKSKACEEETEGCLSFPGMGGKVRRSEWVKVEALRPNGTRIKVKYEGWKARIFQHEYDHLDGVLYVDRLDAEEREKVGNKLSELVVEYEAAPYNGMEPAL
jgi:peptide deformylase